MYAKLIDEKRELFQWDTGQYMEVSSDVDRVDFHFRDTRGMVYGVFSENGRVDIPDIVLQNYGILDCLIMSVNEGIYTMQRMEIAVIERPMPPGYIMTERGQIVTYDDLNSILGQWDIMLKTGGTMNGDIDMDGYMVTGLDDAEDPGDAVSKHYADSEYVRLRGSRMAGRLNGMQVPVSDDEAANKAYVDSTAKSNADAALESAKTYTNNKFGVGSFSIPSSGWAGSAAPYTNAVAVSGLAETDQLLVDLKASAAADNAEKETDAYADIFRYVVAAGEITFYSFSKPSIDIPMQYIKVVQR